MTSVRHGPLWGSTDGAASGWVRMTCDCGWKGTVQPSTLYAIEEYGDHRDQAEVEQLRRFVGEIRTALRPYNGTCYLDMEGRSGSEALAEVCDVMLSEIQELFRYLGLEFRLHLVRNVPWDVMAAKFAYLLARSEGYDGDGAEQWASDLIAYAIETEASWNEHLAPLDESDDGDEGPR